LAHFFAARHGEWLNRHMEQPDAAAVTISMVTLGRRLSSEARASLEAVRVAQDAARLRARRQTAQTRIWFTVLLGAVVVAAIVAGPRVASRWRHARPQAATSVRTAQVPPQAVAAATTAPAVETRTPEPPATSATEPAPVASATPMAATTTAAARNVAGTDKGCDTELIRTAPWRLSAEACARAFESDPTNAALALAIAHAEHADMRLAESAQWAKRALALDPTAAEAYVLIGRAEMKTGNHDGARTAYRHYLELAPRGWHQAEARAAVRRARATAPADSARDR
jgi:Flp pilus assembly protein TadD